MASTADQHAQDTPSAPTPPPTGAQIIIGGAAPRFAVPDCLARAGDEAGREACRTITTVLRNDLKFEGLFQFVPETLIATLPPLNPEAPNFLDWKGVGATILVTTRAEVKGGELTLELRIYSVETSQAMLTKRYTGRADNPRVFAHQSSDDIMTLTQWRGVARTKIAFISDRDATPTRRTKEIYIVDYDGFNPRRVTANNYLNLLPAWRPDGRALAYVSYRAEGPSIFMASIYEGRNTNLTGGKGQAFAPAFSPDGKRVAYSSTRGGNADIWVVNADGTGARRLTTSSAAETAPSWSPTGQEIAFTSDRSGSPQVWIMDSEGLNVRRLTNVGNWNDAPTWNPSKQFAEIAYSARIDGPTFEVAVIDLATHQVRQITEGRGSCESPSWAPSGRHLVVACNRGGPWQITVADRLGRFVQTLPAGSGNNTQPDWGP